MTLQQDLSEYNSAAKVFAFCEGRELKVDVLVNNAGIGIYGRHTTIPIDKMYRMLMLNIVTATELVTLFGNSMKENKGGKILITASTASFQPLPMMAAYGASKIYLLNFTRALNCEMKPFGVQVSCLCPGTTRTNFLNQAGISAHGGKTSFGSIAHRVQADPAGVARAGYRGLMKGKEVIVPGLVNRLHYLVSGILPGRVVSTFAHLIFKRGYDHGDG